MSDESNSPAVPDTPTDEDKLGFDRFAVPLARNIAATDRKATPWTIGVYGEWGSGKTSFLKMVDKALKAEGVRTVWFEAWKYVREDNLWAALIDTVVDKAKRGRGPWVRLQIWWKSVDWWPGLWELFRKLFVLAFRIAMLAVLVLMTISLIPVGANPVNDAVARSVTDSSFLRILIGIAALLFAKPDALLKLFDIKLGADLTKFRRRRAHREQTALLDDFNAEFRGVLEVAYKKKPLVVIIDDLDRCLPEQTLQIIETVKLFLNEPGCVFLLAVDREIIEHAIAVKYKDLPELESRRQLGETYFEKVVQLPYSLPPADDSRVEEFIRSLSADSDVHDCVPVLRGSPPYNPRRIKRSVQAFALLKDFASRELTDTKAVPAVLAKLVIIQAQFRQVYRAAVNDHGLLGKLEQAYRSPESVDEKDLVFVEQVKLYTERHPGLSALLCLRICEQDTFVGVALVRYLSFVDSVAVAEEPPASVATSAERTALVSYLREDVLWGDWLVEQLSGRGFAVTTADPAHPMQDIDENTFTRVFGVVSGTSVRSEAARQGWATAIVAETEFLPVQVERCELPELLADRRVLELTGLDDDEARTALANALGSQRTTNTVIGDMAGTVVQARDIHFFPGRGAAINNLPPTRVDGVRRGELLHRIADCFGSPTFSGVPTICALVGIAGGGKTHLAQMYARENAPKYDVIWWVRANAAREDMAALARALEVPEGRVHQELARRRWLLIFDGADDPERDADLFPKAGSGDVLVTSRDRGWRLYGTQIDVGPFIRAQSVELLSAASDDRKAMERIAELLGDLPLPLALAEDYMRTSGTPASDYLKLISERAGSTGGEVPQLDDPVAEHVLRVLAWLGPGAVPRDLLRRTATIEPQTFDTALAQLNKLSLVDLRPSGVFMHEVSRRAIRASMDGATARDVLRTVPRGAIDAVIGQVERKPKRGDAESLLAHVLTLAGHTQLLDQEVRADLFGYSGLLRHALGDWAAALDLAEEALSTWSSCPIALDLDRAIRQARVRPPTLPSKPHLQIVMAGRARSGKSALAHAIRERLDGGEPTLIDAGAVVRHEYQTEARHYAQFECTGEVAVARLLTHIATPPDCVLLLVSVDEGPGAGTADLVEFACETGVPRFVVAITRCDTVGAKQADAAEVQVRTFMAQFSREFAVVRVSSTRPEDVDPLVRVIEDFVPTPELLVNGQFRMGIRGVREGGVVSGRVDRGRVTVGAEVVLAAWRPEKPKPMFVGTLQVDGRKRAWPESATMSILC